MPAVINDPQVIACAHHDAGQGYNVGQLPAFNIGVHERTHAQWFTIRVVQRVRIFDAGYCIEYPGPFVEHAFRAMEPRSPVL